MIKTTTYTPFDLEQGECSCCGEETKEILINDGRCIDCIQEQNFYDETMKGL